MTKAHKRPEFSTNEIVVSTLGWLYWADLCTVSNAWCRSRAGYHL